jgi:hypothetical protein
LIKKIIESLPEYNALDEKSVKIFEEKTFENFLAFLYLENADRTKYGSLLTGLNTQQSLGNNQYPKSVTEANNVLRNHKLDNSAKFKKENEDTKSKHKFKKEREEAKEQEVTLSFAQMEGKCYCCGKPGHRSPTCRFKNKPREEWAIHRHQQSFARSSGSSNESTTAATVSTSQSTLSNQVSETSRTATRWAGAHIRFDFAQTYDMQDWILLDNQSSVTVFSNKELVENIRDTNVTLTLHTNGGVLTTSQKCDIPQWGKAWFASDGLTNIFSYAEMAERYKITTDSEVENAFIVHLPDKKVKFEKNENNL